MKLPDRKLAVMIGALLAFDVLILSLWSGVSPLVADNAVRLISDREHHYKQCTATAQGGKFAIVMVTTKAALILFGCLMAFGTRRVTTTFVSQLQSPLVLLSCWQRSLLNRYPLISSYLMCCLLFCFHSLLCCSWCLCFCFRS